MLSWEVVRMVIGNRIIALRGKDSRRSFAKRIGIAENTLRNYEENLSLPNSDVVATICKEFGVSAEWLIHGVLPMYKPEEVNNDGSLPEKERDMYLEMLKAKDEVIAAKDLAIQAYKDVLRATRENLDELTDKKGEERTSAGISAPGVHFSGRSSRD